MVPDPDYALFAKVVEAGSLSAAARDLGLSPPMVSKRIARLETRLGVRLLHRTTRRLALTSQGEAFHEDVLAILAAIDAAEARLAGRQGLPLGRLRISAPTSFGRLHVAPYLKGFLDHFPRVRLELDLTDEFVDLFGDGRDLAIRITSQVDASLAHKRLADSRRVLCAAPAYIAAHGAPTSLAALKQHRLLAATGQSPWRLTGGGADVEVEVRSHVPTNSSEVVRELALAGVGIALRSTWDVGADLAAGRLVQVLPQFEGAANVGIFAVYPRTPFVPARVARFVEYLEGLYRPSPPWIAAALASTALLDRQR